MECSLEKLRAQERKISVIGESLSQTEQTVRELDSLEKRAQVSASCHPVHVVCAVTNTRVFLTAVCVLGGDESGSGSYPARASAGCWAPLCNGSDYPAL